MSTLSDVVNEFINSRSRLAAQFLNDNDPFAYLKDHSLVADKAVCAVCELHDLSNRISIVALGGYGRQELFPFSDLDLLFLLPDDVLDKELRQIEQVINDLWSLGLTIGYSVRSIDECIEQGSADITAQTAMLESRFLRGNHELYENYRQVTGEYLNFFNFFRAKFIEQQQRHQKYQESIYTLEPNIKESPGGLRDLNILTWILKASEIENARTHSQRRLLTDFEEKEIQRVTHNLFWLRMHIHLLTNRHEDRMIFEIQESLAKKLGIAPQDERRASEVLMQRFYKNATLISNLNAVILQAVKEAIMPENLIDSVDLGNGFVLKGDILDVKDPDFYKKDPQNFIRPFVLSIENPEITRFSTAVYRSFGEIDAYIGDDFHQQPQTKANFLKILKAKKGVYHMLRDMNRWGILAKILPTFSTIICQMQYDLFHAYTVDQHTLLAIRYLRHFTRAENAHEMPLLTELMMSLKDNWRVVVALLYHDIGKGKGGDHSQIGALAVREFAKTYGLKPEDADYIEFLVREHLSMSHVAQKQDISDPQVVDSFAAKVGNMERLSGLYLLTVCDIRATSPAVWNGWKARLLEELFYAAGRRLKGEVLSRSMLVETKRNEALLLGNFSEKERETINNFWNEFDVAYFMRHSVKTIVWHAKTLMKHLDSHKAFVAAKPVSGIANAHEFLVLTQDKPEVFAKIVSLFQTFNLSILEARIHTGNTGRVLDTFLAIDDGTHPDIEGVLQRFSEKLSALLDKEDPLNAPSTGRLARQSRLFPIVPSVELRPDVAGKQYLLSLVATDRIGLLAVISKVFIQYKINLITARIATLGGRAEDVFLIQNPSLSNAAFSAALETDLLKALEL